MSSAYLEKNQHFLDTKCEINTVFINHCDKIESPGKYFYFFIKMQRQFSGRKDFFVMYLFGYLFGYWIFLSYPYSGAGEGRTHQPLSLNNHENLLKTNCRPKH